MSNSDIKILIVDDSAVARGVWTKKLSPIAGLSLDGYANNGEEAVRLVQKQDFDVIIMDVEMPIMDGVEALKEILKIKPSAKVIMASALTSEGSKVTVKALSLGASDYIAKPSSMGGESIDKIADHLVTKIRALGTKSTPKAQSLSIPKGKTESKEFSPLALAIGSSTGGPVALNLIFSAIKKKPSIPIFITQHMPPLFTKSLAERLAKLSGLDVHEAIDGEKVEAGKVYIAPGDFHLEPQKEGTSVIIKVTKNPPENLFRPSVNPMFRSLAKCYTNRLMCIMLTGMGKDGLEGTEDVFKSKGYIIAQDEKTSTVWGMPGAITEAGLTNEVLSLDDIIEKVKKVV